MRGIKLKRGRNQKPKRKMRQSERHAVREREKCKTQKDTAARDDGQGATEVCLQRTERRALDLSVGCILRDRPGPTTHRRYRLSTRSRRRLPPIAPTPAPTPIAPETRDAPQPRPRQLHPRPSALTVIPGVDPLPHPLLDQAASPRTRSTHRQPSANGDPLAECARGRQTTERQPRQDGQTASPCSSSVGQRRMATQRRRDRTWGGGGDEAVRRRWVMMCLGRG